MSGIDRLMLPLLRLLPPERAHMVTLGALKSGAAPRRAPKDDPVLGVSLWGRHFPNPIGLAAGFDKNAEVPDAMLRWGFGFVEIGSVTPRPQDGNPKPRLFRLTEDAAVINRMGFNNDGLETVAARLRARRRTGIVGANLGKNRDTEDAASDYVKGVAALGSHADYLVVNVSSPNTPGLRNLQRRGEITGLLRAVQEARHDLATGNPPILVKVAPDLDDGEIADLAEAALATGIDGMIVSNTTIARPNTLKSREAKETGGLSGKPLFAPSTRVLAEMYRLTQGRLTLIGAGGISSGADAYEKIKSGASLVQLYTALVYGGPKLVREIKRDLAAAIRADGFTSVAGAVGSSLARPAGGRRNAG